MDDKQKPPNNERSIVSCEPWPQFPIEFYTSIASGEWGFLFVYSDGTISFDDSERPSDSEIEERWGYALRRNSQAVGSESEN